MRWFDIVGLVSSFLGGISALYLISVTNNMELWMPCIAFVVLFVLFLRGSNRRVKT